MEKRNKSYSQILKSTSIFGGSQVVTILIGIVRNKVLAILLGTMGLGLISIYQSTLDMIKSIASFGIETTGVREIAAVGDDNDQLSYIVSVIDRWTLIFALLGGIVCLAFCYPISIWAFGDDSHVLQFALLSVGVFFSLLAAGQAVVLQGMRKISYLVKSSIIWNVCALVLSLPLYYLYGIDAIVPVFIVVSIVMYLSAYYYRKKIGIQSVAVSFTQMRRKEKSVLRIGFFIVVASILTSLGFFVIRAFLSNRTGIDSVGLFQAAWTVTNIYLMLILKSMGSDFYPRLCAIITDNNKIRQLINEQTYIVLIVSVPMIVLLLLCSKIALTWLYSPQFGGAVGVLNWQIGGTFFKVLSWPLGFILLAKGKGLLYLLSESFFLLIYLGGLYLLYPFFQFDAIGISYLVAYSLYLVLVWVQGKKLSHFAWTAENRQIGFISMILVSITFGIVMYMPNYAWVVGIPIFCVSLAYSVYKLNQVFPLKSLIGKR